MSRHSNVTAALAAVALLGLAGCASSDGSGAEPKQEKSPLASLDTCKIMTPQQLEAGGFTFDGRAEALPFEPGCSYINDTVGVSIYKNQRETVQSYKKNRDTDFFESTQVNGRAGANTKPTGAMEDQCSTLIPAGGGVIIVDTQKGDPLKPIDGCAESMKIAQQIEPNLPE